MQSLVQNGRLAMARRFNESFIIRPDAKVRSLLPAEVLFTSPIVVTVMQGEFDDQIQLSVQADKRLNIVRSELVDEAELKSRNSLLYRTDLDLVEHRNLLKDELIRVDEERRQLKERITNEGESAKCERRSADRKKINGWKHRDEDLLAYRTEVRNKLGDIKEAIKQRNISNSGRVPQNDLLATAFMETAQAFLPEAQFHQILQLSEGRLREDRGADDVSASMGKSFPSSCKDPFG